MLGTSSGVVAFLSVKNIFVQNFCVESVRARLWPLCSARGMNAFAAAGYNPVPAGVIGTRRRWMPFGYGKGSAVDQGISAVEVEASQINIAARAERRREEERKSLADIRDVARDGHGGEYWNLAARIGSDWARRQNDENDGHQDKGWEFITESDLAQSSILCPSALPDAGSRKSRSRSSSDQGLGDESLFKGVTRLESDGMNPRSEGRWRRQWGRPKTAWLPERSWR